MKTFIPSEKFHLTKNVMKMINEIKEEYIKKYGENLVSIVLFGSYANKVSTICSDIDLLIILENLKTTRYKIYLNFFSILENLSTYKKLREKKIYLNFSPIIKTTSELKISLPYLWETNFKIFYDKNGFFKNFIKKLKEFKRKKIRKIEGIMPYYEWVKNGE